MARTHWCFTCKKFPTISEYDTCTGMEHDIDYEDLFTPVGTKSLADGEIVKFSDIDSKHNNKRILFKAKVISTSDILSYDMQRTYICPACAYIRKINCDDYREIKAGETMLCEECKEAKMFLDHKQTITGNLRKVVLQETMDEMGMNPRRIEAETIADFVFDLNAGKDYKFDAILWSKQINTKSNVNRFVLNIMRLRCIDSDTNILPSETEIKVFKEKSITQVAASLAPHIKYREKEKLSVLLSMVSGGKVDGIRGDFSVFLCGDPSTGKSQIINASVEHDKRSQKVSGRTTSAAGLVMGVDNLPDGTRMATFGPVVLCHGHHVAIDEMDKMRAEDRSSLHDVMEDQMAHLNKVGINLSVPAETKIIGACNPKASHYDKDATIKANLGMPDSFLARFGYIFLMLDDFPQEKERECIRHINRIKEVGLEKVIEENDLLTKEELTKYINYAKSFNPVMTHEATSKLEDLYIHIKYMKQEAGSLNIDKRTYYDIIRASYSFARMRFSDEVTLEDVNNAWQLKLDALESFGMRTVGDFHQSALAPDLSSERKDYIERACISIMDENKMINHEKLAYMLQENKRFCKDIGEAKNIIQMLKNWGRLLNTGTEGVYKYHG